MALKANIQDSNQCHVLAVDDSLLDRKLLERILTISSCQVTCVESGSKALEYLGLPDSMDPSSHACPATQRAVDVDLIITDYSMPGMSGYDLLTRVKRSSWKDIPVVVMSSENVPARIIRCLEGGAEEFLLKPVQLSDMKKLQPHLHKSLHCSCISSSSDDTRNKDHNEEGGHRHNNNHDQTRTRGLT